MIKWNDKSVDARNQRSLYCGRNCQAYQKNILSISKKLWKDCNWKYLNVKKNESKHSSDYCLYFKRL